MIKLNDLKKAAAKIRNSIFESVIKAGKGHIGGALSSTDILVTLYHGKILNIRADAPDDPDRDRFILSKGHSGVALYNVLADLNFFPASELKTICCNGTRLGEHPDMVLPGVETITGSLGHGLGIGAGLGWSAKHNNQDFMTFVLMGDGECYEGSIWEAAMFAAHHALDNLVMIIDRNQQITLNYTEDCIKLDSLEKKFSAFGWEVESIDGHSFSQLTKVLAGAKNRKTGQPLAIIANTVKGKGISYMEGQLKWHHGLPNQEEIKIGRQELEIMAEKE
jgi:transketolase